MTTTDANGIAFVEVTDAISPFHTLVNGLQTATSNAITGTRLAPLPTANNTTRDALYASLVAGGRVPASYPVYVDRLDTGAIERNAGSGWVPIAVTSWTSYTPTLGGMLLNNGTMQAAYTLVNKTLTVSIEIIWGSTTSFGGAAGTPIGITIPPGLTSAARRQTVSGWINDSSAVDYVASGRILASSNTFNVALNGALMASVHNSLPMLWAVNDSLMLGGSIQVA